MLSAVLCAQSEPDAAQAVARAVARLLLAEVLTERIEGDERLTLLAADACEAPERYLVAGAELEGDLALSGHGRDTATGELLIGVADASGALWAVSLDLDRCELRVRDEAHVVIRASAGWPLPALRPFGSTPVELPW